MENKIKILELDGNKYSRKEFEGYAFRAIIKIKTSDNDFNRIDIYTTDSNKENVLKVLEERKNERVVSISLENWCTKEQDDRNSEFINEWLNEN